MAKTIFITGSSAGMGHASAQQLLNEGWNVVATMRNPERASFDTSQNKNLLVTPLDVTQPDQINSALDASKARFGGVDVLFNNAGFGLFGPLEAVSLELFQKQFATNVQGAFLTMKAFIPHFRARGGGLIVNNTSVGGRITLPFFSIYHATKFALEGMSESIYFELKPFNIRIKIIEPGSVESDFSGRSLGTADEDGVFEVYKDAIHAVTKSREERTAARLTSKQAAAFICEAINDPSPRLRYLVGEDAKDIVERRNTLSQEVYYKTVEKVFGLAPMDDNNA